MDMCWNARFILYLESTSRIKLLYKPCCVGRHCRQKADTFLIQFTAPISRCHLSRATPATPLVLLLWIELVKIQPLRLSPVQGCLFSSLKIWCVFEKEIITVVLKACTLGAKWHTIVQATSWRISVDTITNATCLQGKFPLLLYFLPRQLQSHLSDCLVAMFFRTCTNILNLTVPLLTLPLH